MVIDPGTEKGGRADARLRDELVVLAHHRRGGWEPCPDAGLVLVGRGDGARVLAA